ncbi:MAG: SpoVR family protein [Fimbriimonadia bacterium]|jgi:stage V sporulation protein R
MTQAEREELNRWLDAIYEKALEMGLDPFPVHFEVVPDHVIYELGAYGLPARFSHWTFGRDYHRMKTSYEYNLTRIYEIIFNTDPSQAFLLDSNSMLSHKLVAAHCYGHSDFFKNNTYFQHTDRSMIERARLHAERIRKYQMEHGPEVVERFLDAAMSIQEHLDPAKMSRPNAQPVAEPKENEQPPRGPYDDIWYVVEEKPAPPAREQRFPPEPEKDLLLFLRDYARDLEPWQRDCLEILRDEMLYFLPQMRTKIMNEGWASYWHEKILESLPLTSEEHLEFRRMHSAVLSPGGSVHLNPYYVGYQIFKDIERRWNGEPDPDGEPEEDWLGNTIERPTGQGRERIFQSRLEDDDQSFLGKYLTAGLCKRMDLFTYKMEEINGEMVWVVQETDWRKVRDALVAQMTNLGAPYVTVEDGDFEHRGELLLRHHYDGRPLDFDYTARTLRNLAYIWGRPVHVDTVSNDEPVRISCDGENITQTGT